MIKRWVHAQIALDEQNNPVGILYTGKGINPYPMIKPPPQVTQRVREPTETLKLDHHEHAEKVRKIYRQAQNYQ